MISPTRRQIQAPIDQGVTFVAGVASAFTLIACHNEEWCPDLG